MPSWGNAPVTDNSRAPRLEELVDMVDLPDKEFLQVRLVGPITSYAEHWFDIKKRDGGKARLRKTCLNFNPDTGEAEDRGCPYCAAGMKSSTKFLGNVIVRELEQTEPRNKPPLRPSEQVVKTLGIAGDPYSIKAHLKAKGSKSWTPVRVLRAPPTLVNILKSLTTLNKHGGEPRELSDPKYGRDVMVKYDSKAAGTSKYAATIGNDPPAPLSNTERRYLMYDIFGIVVAETQQEAERDWQRLSAQWIPEKGEGDSDSAAADDADDSYYGDDSATAVPPSRQAARGGARRAAAPADSWDADDEDDTGLEETAEVTRVPARGAARPAPAQQRRPAPVSTQARRSAPASDTPKIGSIHTVAGHGRVKVLAINAAGNRVQVMKPNQTKLVLDASDFNVPF